MAAVLLSAHRFRQRRRQPRFFLSFTHLPFSAAAAALPRLQMERMEKSIESVQRHFASVRTGRANPTMLDRIEVGARRAAGWGWVVAWAMGRMGGWMGGRVAGWVGGWIAPAGIRQSTPMLLLQLAAAARCRSSRCSNFCVLQCSLLPPLLTSAV